jgi:hypothetical protein
MEAENKIILKTALLVTITKIISQDILDIQSMNQPVPVAARSDA